VTHPLPVNARTPGLRRQLGPTAWCTLEALLERADGTAVAVASVRSLAAELGVAKNTAHRALATLMRAGLVQPVQERGADGRFRPGRYRLHLADRPASTRRPRTTRTPSTPTTAVPAVEAQLSLLPPD
jgi:DNA-binding IclR family transcriptional regulator